MLEIIDYSRAYGRNISDKKFDLAGSTIIYWMKMEDELRNQKNKKLKITIHKDLNLNMLI